MYTRKIYLLLAAVIVTIFGLLATFPGDEARGESGRGSSMQFYDPITPDYKNCLEKSQTAGVAARCVQDEASMWEARVEFSYAAARADAPDGWDDVIVQSHKEWKEFRDAQCAVDKTVNAAGDDVAEYIAAMCRISTARAWAFHLEMMPAVAY